MEGLYPVFIDGRAVGKLRIRRAGAMTEFSAETGMLPGIVRISVYGGGREGYLGVLAPEGDGMSLRKCLSPGAMRDFPTEIDAVERAGCTELLRESESAPQTETPPPTLPADTEDEELFWYSSPDGALVRFDGSRNLIALPLGDPRIPEDGGGRLRQVDGRQYLVFATENGRLVRE